MFGTLGKLLHKFVGKSSNGDKNNTLAKNLPPTPELEDPAVKSVSKAEKRSGVLENKLSRIEGRIDPLRAMVERMRNEDFWR